LKDQLKESEVLFSQVCSVYFSLKGEIEGLQEELEMLDRLHVENQE
jgi:hypothetical protein